MSAPRIPIRLENWISKNKTKDVAIWFHDDLDGIYSAAVLKKWLLERNFNITRYGVVNYQDSWSYIKLNNNEINIAVDFSEMNDELDAYIDHHGQPFGKNNKNFAIKCETHSAYEAVCLQLGIPTDKIALSVIDMVDSAKYEDYGIDVKDILTYDFEDFKRMGGLKSKLLFASVINQFIKRGDHKTLIEVLHNIGDVSIYNIFRCFKILHPGNNKGAEFITDGESRIAEMKKRCLAHDKKVAYKSQKSFIKHNMRKDYKIYKGYQILGDLAYFPSSTWANPIRAKSIIHTDMDMGYIPKNIKYILLQYGNTLQVAYVDRKIMQMKGAINIGKYMVELLDKTRLYLYYHSRTVKNGKFVEDTVAGGHKGIGTISNIYGTCEMIDKYKGVKFLDFMKNKMIKDLSSIKWDDVSMSWKASGKKGNYKKPIENFRVLEVKDIRIIKKNSNEIISAFIDSNNVLAHV